MELTQKRLRELLRYDPATGVFVWLVTRGGVLAGTRAGSLHSRGYIEISISRRIYKAHRLAHLYMLGRFPSEGVDHENHIKSDNRWLSIREADQGVNNKNTSKRKDNTSGTTGVHLCRKSNKWKAQINVEGVRTGLGTFVTHFAACYARHAANLKYEYHPNHGAN